ncbi:MAG: hypothetical protein MAG451_02581 [Anaerolineales bacterium]|nr:hypothetical protein [Anaerolineales bacterium]
MYRLTGEEDTLEGIKGVGALTVLWLTQRPPQTAPFAPMPHVDVNPYGVNTFLQLEAEEKNVRRQLKMLHDAGVGWVRQEFPWEDIEIHAKGDFEDRRTEPHKSAWLKYDRIVDLAQEHEIQILARLDNPPAWSRAQGDEIGTLAPPDDFEDFGDFAAAVADRYCGRIDYYQVWNEPNIYPEWGEQDVDPEAYTELLTVAYERIKEACPGATVVSAALAQNVEAGGRNMSDLIFLERMYAAGAGDDFDVLGAQAFGLWTGPTDRRASRDRANFSRIELTRDIMVRHGDPSTGSGQRAGKPIWVTEMGWAAVPEDIPTVFGRVTREQQARYLVDAYRRANSEWPFVGPLFAWFLRRPDWSEQDQDWFYFGLISPDWETTPAFDALAVLASALPAVPPGLYQEDHPALHYGGDWQPQSAPEASLGAYRVGAPGSLVSFAFEGSDATLVAVAESTSSTGILIIDGEKMQFRLPAREYHRLARYLPTGRHVVAVRVDQGALALDAILIRSTHDRLVRHILVSLALVFAVVAVTTLIRYTRQTDRQSLISKGIPEFKTSQRPKDL